MKKRKIFILIITGPLRLLAGLAALLCFVAAYPFIFACGQWLKFRFWQRLGKHGRFVLFDSHSARPATALAFMSLPRGDCRKAFACGFTRALCFFYMRTQL